MKLINGDCIEEMKRLADASIDMVMTDPPYGTTACKWDTVIPLDLMWRELKRITRPRAAIVLMAGQPFTSALVMSNPKMFKYCWVWEKNMKTGNLNARYMPMGGHEDITIFYAKVPTYNAQKRARTTEPKTGGKRNSRTSVYGKQKENHVWGQSDWINPDTIIRDIKCANRKKGKLHPTQKPVELIEYLIKTYSDPGATVLDFAMGSGTTGVACKNLDREFIGIELDHNYFKIAEQRIYSEQGRLL